jgi:hypothetical protein
MGPIWVRLVFYDPWVRDKAIDGIYKIFRKQSNSMAMRKTLGDQNKNLLISEGRDL